MHKMMSEAKQVYDNIIYIIYKILKHEEQK